MSGPPPPPPPPAPAAKAAAPARGALLSSIQAGTKLKKVETKDCSAPITSRAPSQASGLASPVNSSNSVNNLSAAAPRGGNGPAGFGDIFAAGRVQLRHAGGPTKTVEKKVATIRRGTQLPSPSAPVGKTAASPAKTAEIDAELERTRKAREAADLAAKAQIAAEEKAKAERQEIERLQAQAKSDALKAEQRKAQEQRAADEARKAAEREAERRVQAAATAERERVRREEKERVEREMRLVAEKQKREADERTARAAEEARVAQERSLAAEQEAARARKLALERAAAAAEAVAASTTPTKSGGSRGFCTRCGQGLTGTTVQLETSEIIHAACFKCDHCAAPLAESYNVVGGESLCDGCSRREIEKSAQQAASGAANFCTRCGGKLTGEYIVIDEQPMHRHCLTCQDCSCELMPKGVAAVNLKRLPNEAGVFCDKCVAKRMDVDKCDVCNKPLGVGQFLNVLGHRMHPACLKCKKCSKALPRDQIYSAGGWPACADHGE